VMGNGKIYLEVEPEVSNLDPSVGTTIQGTSVPGRTTQNVHTAVMMEDGQTLALGGLIQNEVTAHLAKVPILGSIPVVGAAFSSKTFQETERELIVLVTPHVVDPMSCDQVPKLVPGQETRSPDDFELFLEGILEAPRGPREVFQDGQYVPAYKNGPTAGTYPCGNGKCGQCKDGCAPGAAPSGKAPDGVDQKSTLTGSDASSRPQVYSSPVDSSKPNVLPPPMGGLSSTDKWPR